MMPFVNFFGPGAPGCLDCIDGQCTMNCSSRGGLEPRDMRQVEDNAMTAIRTVLQSTLPGIPVTISTPPNDRPHPLFDLLRDATEQGMMRVALEKFQWPPLEWLKEGEQLEMRMPIPLGNLYQPGGTLNTSEDRQAIADAFGLKIFADPRVPPGEIWMGVDLSTRPDITAYRDADGKIHIITAGKETE